MFVIDQSGTFEWPVEYKTPSASKPGKYDTFTFTAVFKRLEQKPLEALLKRVAEQELDDAGLLDEVLVGWSGIKTSGGDDFAVNDTNRAILYDQPGVKAAIAYTYLDVIAVKANQKN